MSSLEQMIKELREKAFNCELELKEIHKIRSMQVNDKLAILNSLVNKIDHHLKIECGEGIDVRITSPGYFNLVPSDETNYESLSTDLMNFKRVIWTLSTSLSDFNVELLTTYDFDIFYIRMYCKKSVEMYKINIEDGKFNLKLDKASLDSVANCQIYDSYTSSTNSDSHFTNWNSECNKVGTLKGCKILDYNPDNQFSTMCKCAAYYALSSHLDEFEKLKNTKGLEAGYNALMVELSEPEQVKFAYDINNKYKVEPSKYTFSGACDIKNKYTLNIGSSGENKNRDIYVTDYSNDWYINKSSNSGINSVSRRDMSINNSLRARIDETEDRDEK